jgi:hypothetical protein
MAAAMGQRAGSAAAALSLSVLLLVGAPGGSMVSPPTAIAAEAEVAKRAVDEYIAMGNKLSLKQLEEFRGRYRLRRAPDGRVQLKSTRGDWWSVRLDMEVGAWEAREACSADACDVRAHASRSACRLDCTRTHTDTHA